MSRFVSKRYINRDWWDLDYPRALYDQKFGLELADSDLQLYPSSGYYLRPKYTISEQKYTGSSQVINDKDKFKVLLDVGQFTPEEIEVKVVDDTVTVHAKHEEKSDQHGFVSREFTRRYLLPEGTEMDKVVSALGPDGILTVEAPKVVPPEVKANERRVPITLRQTSVTEEEKTVKEK